MGALIDITSNTSSNLQNGELITLLKQKIEDSILSNRSVIITISNPIMECRNTIYTDDYEIDGNKIYLNNGNFELHIDINETEIKRDDTCANSFTFVYKNMEIRLDFLE